MLYFLTFFLMIISALSHLPSFRKCDHAPFYPVYFSSISLFLILSPLLIIPLGLKIW